MPGVCSNPNFQSRTCDMTKDCERAVYACTELASYCARCSPRCTCACRRACVLSRSSPVSGPATSASGVSADSVSSTCGATASVPYIRLLPQREGSPRCSLTMLPIRPKVRDAARAHDSVCERLGFHGLPLIGNPASG